MTVTKVVLWVVIALNVPMALLDGFAADWTSAKAASGVCFAAWALLRLDRVEAELWRRKAADTHPCERCAHGVQWHEAPSGSGPRPLAFPCGRRGCGCSTYLYPDDRTVS